MKKRVSRGDPRRQRYWEEAVRRWREGGQSVRAFCRAEGLRESAFYFWRGELARRGHRTRERAHDAGNGSRPPARPAAPGLRSPRPRRRRGHCLGAVSLRNGPTPAFLPVQVVAPASGYPATECSDVAEASRSVEIVLAQGRTVRVRPGFDRQTLVDVLAVLEGRPC